MLHGAKIAVRHGPKWEFFAFCKYFHCFQPISLYRMVGSPQKLLLLGPMLICFTRKSRLNEYLLQS